MARPRKPTAIKALQGTLQPCRTNKNEPVPELKISQIDPPEYLNPVAKKAWLFAVSQMPEGMVTGLDFSVFALWADTYSKILELESAIQHQGLTVFDEKRGYDIPNPLLKAQNELKQVLRGYITELGFSPASRSKVSVQSKKKEETNGFLNF
ncbi:MAG: phage terminase small subunit P27 family [Succinivibrio sp.]|nr:phage terminase small subunit P27 family [Succinivibrio sp.]